jgi:peptidoglycan/xylan/chitin deacetylase (PgdA/CDA1 family)
MTTITLSFDNGPDPEVTPLVLDILRLHDIRATFFVIGEKLRERRRLVELAHAEGHWIGNHTYNHLVPLGLCGEDGQAASEIERAQALIGNLGHPRRLFRPFGNGGKLGPRLLNKEALAHLERMGYTCVLWSAVPEDWIYPKGWVERALELCLAQDHALLVLHDLPTGAMARLDQFLRQAKENGASFSQDFPSDCVVMERGRLLRDIEPYMADSP